MTGFEACCGCGGGIPEFELCNNFKTADESDWTDAQGRNCDAYEEFHLCYEEGHKWANMGMTANQACCACRGGAIGTCQDYEGFITDIYNTDCSWYYENVNDEIDADTRCHHFGDDVGVYAGGTATTNEACCVCGGGISTLDYPSFAPAGVRVGSSSPSSSGSSVSSSSSSTDSSGSSSFVSTTGTLKPTKSPTRSPTVSPAPTKTSSNSPSKGPTKYPSSKPSKGPTDYPSINPTLSNEPSLNPSKSPTISPTSKPTDYPSSNPISTPSLNPSNSQAPAPVTSAPVTSAPVATPAPVTSVPVAVEQPPTTLAPVISGNVTSAPFVIVTETPSVTPTVSPISSYVGESSVPTMSSSSLSLSNTRSISITSIISLFYFCLHKN